MWHVRCGNDMSDSVPVTLAPVIVDDDMVPAMRVAVVVYEDRLTLQVVG